MNTPISQLVDELISADPSLKQHKAELVKLVETMRATEPAWQPDEQFVRSLRSTLEHNTPSLFQSFISLFSMNNVKPLLFGGAGLITVALLAIVVTAVPGFQSTLGIKSISTTMPNRFVMAEANAFGSLAGLDVSSAFPTTNPAFGLKERAIGFGGGGDMAIDSKMIAPYPITRVRYEYTGEPFTLPSTEEAPVYQYQFMSNDGMRLASLIKGANLDLFSLNSFGNLAVDSIQLKEEKVRGYMVNLNIEQGTANINLNWNTWPELICDDGCEYQEVTPDQVPDDNTLISMATTFLRDRGIDVSDYGDPIVDKRWKLYQDQGNYIPSIMSVVYPFVLPEGLVYDMSGYPHGLSVSVNIQEGMVDSVYNIYAGSYVGSHYTLESTTDRILSYANDGGRPYYPWYSASEQSVVEVTYQLDTPELVYIQHYPPESLVRRLRPRIAGDLFLPALRFPVLGKEVEGAYKPEYILVPVVSDILDSYDVSGREPVFPTEPILLESPSDVSISPLPIDKEAE